MGYSELMGIQKSDFPILEYDSEQISILMPNRKNLYKLAQKCVFAFLGEFVDEYALENKAEKVAEFDTCTKLFHIYQTSYKGEDICICAAPLGASAAVQFLDFLISYGVKHIIACGSCGTLRDTPENEILIPQFALRDEGTSYHYIPPSREVIINQLAIDAIKKSATYYKIPFEECKTWTTDGFFRSTMEMMEYRKQEGCDVVEMECAALAACAQFRGAIFGQILFTADTLAIPDAHNDRDWGASSWENVFKLSLEAVRNIRSIV